MQIFTCIFELYSFGFGSTKKRILKIEVTAVKISVKPSLDMLSEMSRDIFRIRLLEKLARLAPNTSVERATHKIFISCLHDSQAVCQLLICSCTHYMYER